MNEKFWDGLILKAEQRTEAGYTSNPLHWELLRKRGIVLSDLKPSGFIMVGGEKYDASSEGEMIERGTVVEVIRMTGAIIIVRRV